MAELSLTLRNPHGQHEPTAIPWARLTHEAVDALGAFAQELITGTGQLPADPSAVPGRGHQTLAGDPGQRLPGRLLLDPKCAEGFDQGARPDLAAPGMDELSEDREQQRACAGGARLALAADRLGCAGGHGVLRGCARHDSVLLLSVISWARIVSARGVFRRDLHPGESRGVINA